MIRDVQSIGNADFFPGLYLNWDLALAPAQERRKERGE